MRIDIHRGGDVAEALISGELLEGVEYKALGCCGVGGSVYAHHNLHNVGVGNVAHGGCVGVAHPVVYHLAEPLCEGSGAVEHKFGRGVAQGYLHKAGEGWVAEGLTVGELSLGHCLIVEAGSLN